MSSRIFDCFGSIEARLSSMLSIERISESASRAQFRHQDLRDAVIFSARPDLNKDEKVKKDSRSKGHSIHSVVSGIR